MSQIKDDFVQRINTKDGVVASLPTEVEPLENINVFDPDLSHLPISNTLYLAPQSFLEQKKTTESKKILNELLILIFKCLIILSKLTKIHKK